MSRSAATPVKFRFDLDLGHRSEPDRQVSESVMEAMVAAARSEGYERGLADGERTVSAGAALRLSQAADQLADRIAQLSARADEHRRQTLSDAIGLAAAIGRKLAGQLLAKEPLAEIEALITECLASLEDVPHLVIRCAPELADAVRETATQRIAVSGFAGRLVVIGDPDQALGDARIEWVDGGVVRDRATLEAEIDARIAAYLAAEAGTAPDHTTEAHR